MIEITYLQLFLLITIIWIITRLVVAAKTKAFSIKRELVYCIIKIPKVADLIP